MKRLERYVAALVFGIFASVLLGLVALFLVIDFGDWLRIYTGKPWWDVVTLYWFRSHLAVMQFAPAAMVLAASIGVTLVRRRGEWIALRALGASPATILRPVALVCVAVAALLFGFQELVVSASGPKVDRIMVERFNRWGDYGSVYAPRRWFKAGHALVNVRGEVSEQGFAQVRLFELGPRSELVRWLEGERLTFVADGRWRLSGATELWVRGEALVEGRTGELELELPVRPEVTQLAIGRPEWLPVTVLVKQLELLRTLEIPSEATLFAIHQRWAGLAAAVLAALLAAVRSLQSASRASISRSLLEGAGLFGLLFVAVMIERSLATNGRLPVIVAAWSFPALLALLFAWRVTAGAREPGARRAIRARPAGAP